MKAHAPLQAAAVTDPALPPVVEIRHLEVADLPAELRGAPTEALLIFWLHERPVGQLYVTLPAEGIATAELMARAVHPSEPAVFDRDRPAPPLATRTSVVICTRDRAAQLARCLESLSRQSLPPDEILVVDNGSAGDDTRRAAAVAGVRYLREDRPGLDVARNAGVRAASGEIVAYTDDDVQLHPRWLERLVTAFDADIAAVTGLVLPAELSTAAQVVFERHWGFGRGFHREDFGPGFFAKEPRKSCPVWRIGAGASMAFRRSVFERVGSFDERLDAGAAGCSGDSEFWHRILAAGLKIRYEPAAVACHVHRREMAALERQIFAYARGHTAALLVQHERTGDRRDLKRVWIDLPLYHAGRLVRRRFGRATDRDLFLRQEIWGWAAGLWFYYRTPRSRACGGPAFTASR